jgi:hypothetical protein
MVEVEMLTHELKPMEAGYCFMKNISMRLFLPNVFLWRRPRNNAQHSLEQDRDNTYSNVSVG